MRSRKVKRIYPMHRTMKILLVRELRVPADARAAALTTAILLDDLTRPRAPRF